MLSTAVHSNPIVRNDNNLTQCNAYFFTIASSMPVRYHPPKSKAITAR